MQFGYTKSCSTAIVAAWDVTKPPIALNPTARQAKYDLSRHKRCRLVFSVMKLAHKLSRELLLHEIMALEELENQRPIQEKGQVQEPLDMLGPHCWGCILSACTTADLAR